MFKNKQKMTKNGNNNNNKRKKGETIKKGVGERAGGVPPPKKKEEKMRVEELNLAVKSSTNYCASSFKVGRFMHTNMHQNIFT